MKEKGIEHYLDAAKIIHKDYPNARFHVCGFCEQDYEEILKEYDSDGIIIYHGVVSDMIPFYKMSSCIVHPSYYPEGMSNVLLEGSASARPIITTNRSGCREIVNEGINGFLINQKDTNDLVTALNRFMLLSVEDREKMGMAGRDLVERSFDRRIIINQYLEEVNKVSI